MASKVERIHPIPKFIKKHFDRMVEWWVVATVPILYILAEQMNELELRGLGFVWLALIGIPCSILYMIPKFFSVYRITHCPYCNFHDEAKLGKAFDV